MALFEAYDPFDLRKFDLGRMYRNAVDVVIYDDPYTMDGKTYPQSMLLQKNEANTETYEFFGRGLVIAEGGTGFSAGRFEAYVSWWKDLDENRWYRDFIFSGFSVTATSLFDAMTTESLVDDRAVITRMLAGHDTVKLWSSSDWFDGKAGNDLLRGNAGHDTLYGNTGNDSLWGGTGNDSLLGNSGNDILRGEAGNDTLVGGAGSDILTGGTGADVFLIVDGAGSDVITDFTNGIDHIRLNNGATRFSQLTITDTGADVRVAFGGEVITLRGIEPGIVNAADFIFG